YLLISPAFFRHLPVVRPEIPSLFFLVGGLLIALKTLKNDHRSPGFWVLRFILVGFFFGLAFLSKVQVLPLIVVFSGMLCFYILKYEKGKENFYAGSAWPTL